MSKTAITIAVCNVATVAIMASLAAFFQQWWISLFSILFLQTIEDEKHDELERHGHD